MRWGTEKIQESRRIKMKTFYNGKLNIQKNGWNNIMKSHVLNIQLQLLSTQVILIYFEANKEDLKNMRYLSVK